MTIDEIMIVALFIPTGLVYYFGVHMTVGLALRERHTVDIVLFSAIGGTLVLGFWSIGPWLLRVWAGMWGTWLSPNEGTNPVVDALTAFATSEPLSIGALVNRILEHESFLRAVALPSVQLHHFAVLLSAFVLGILSPRVAANSVNALPDWFAKLMGPSFAALMERLEKRETTASYISQREVIGKLVKRADRKQFARELANELVQLLEQRPVGRRQK